MVLALLFLMTAFEAHAEKRRPAQSGSASKNVSTGSGPDFNERLQSLEQTVERLEAELEILRTQSTMVIRSTQLSFLNATYIKTGLSLVLPRASTFNFFTDTGLGLSGGIGQYLGRNNVLELGIDWDVFLGLTFRYRYEFHTSLTGLSYGPVIGYKTRIADLDPFDHFLDRDGEIRKSFWLLGGYFGVPVGAGAMVSMELTYHANSQQLVFINVNFQFFM